MASDVLTFKFDSTGSNYCFWNRSTFGEVYRDGTVVFEYDNGTGSRWSMLYKSSFVVDGKYVYFVFNNGMDSTNPEPSHTTFPTKHTLSVSTYNHLFSTNTTRPPSENTRLNVSLEEKYSVNVASDPSGVGDVSKSSNIYITNYSSAITIALDEYSTDWKFEGWDDNSSKDLTRQVTPSSDITYTATFSSRIHDFSISAAAGGVIADTSTSSGPYRDGTTLSFDATPFWYATFSKWVINGVNYLIGQSYSMAMPEADLTVEASFIIRPSYALTVSKTNPTKGTIKLTLPDADGTEVLESSNAISSTGYTGLDFTLTATVIDPVHDEFLGWYDASDNQLGANLSYVVNRSVTTAFAVVAKFAQKASYTIETVVIGRGPHDDDDEAGVAGCLVSLSREPDFTDEWLGGNITFTAVAATGWRIAGWTVVNSDDGQVVLGLGDIGPVSAFTMNLDVNVSVTATFTTLPYDFRCSINENVNTAVAGTVAITNMNTEVSAITGTGVTDILVTARYGEQIEFVAAPNVGYGFVGWYDAVTGEPAPDIGDPATSTYQSLTYALGPVTGAKSLVAKFSATVEVNAAHSDDATDADGTVTIDSETAGATVTKDIAIGDTCTITATNGAGTSSGAVFNGWRITGTDDILAGYGASKVITVEDNIDLTADFVAAAEVQEFYVAVRNYNNNTSLYDSFIGIFEIDGIDYEEIQKSEWDTFFSAGVGPMGTGDDGSTAQPPGDRYFKITGTKTINFQAYPAAAMRFLRWQTGWTASGSPYAWSQDEVVTVLGSNSSIDIVTNRHYILDAVWGEPAIVNVTLKYSHGSDGGFLMLPVTNARTDVPSGIRDSYAQGTVITLSAFVENGYLFKGWYYNSSATTLLSTESTIQYEVVAPIEIFAKFEQDTNAVYLWQGGTARKMMEWISKRFVATKPYNPSAAKIYADDYPVELNVYMSSSPNAPREEEPTAVNVFDQDAIRLPFSRPEKYVEIGVKSRNEITNVAVSTSMGGLL